MGTMNPPLFRILLICCLMTLPAAVRASLNSAEVTITYNQVNLVAPGDQVAPAKVGDILRGRSRLETGRRSRAELTFNDQSIARLGANSVFSFQQGTRDLELNQGVILMQVPKAAGGATIQTSAVTAAITGTTIAIEFFPATDSSPGSIKVFVLEGSLRLSVRGGIPGESMLLEAGQMIQMAANAKKLPDPQVFDIQRMVSTAGLMSKQFPPLASDPLIAQNIVMQNAERRKGRLVVSDFTLHSRLPKAAPFIAQQQQTSIREIARQNPASRNPSPSRPAPTTVSRPRPLPQPKPQPVIKKPCPCPTPYPSPVNVGT